VEAGTKDEGVELEAAQAKTAETLSEIASREGFLETSDPALQESADRGKAKLLSYRELYLLWERQQWRTQDLDFARDRTDWHERIDPEERFQRMFGLSAFFTGEQRVTDELGPIMRACPTEEQRIFLSTQIADEARHVQFFDRFYSEVGVLDGTDDLAGRLAKTREHLNEAFGDLFDELLHKRVDRLAAEPDDREALVEAVTLYHMIIEGSLALTGQHFIIEYNEEQNTLPAFVEGFQNVARDEHRHIAFGVRFLTDMANEDERYRSAMQRIMAEALPIADKVLDPPWSEEDDWELFGYSREETHAFAAQCLSRRLKVIGLA
jgi:ribonucleoside-diphosphate reductase beta chain